VQDSTALQNAKGQNALLPDAGFLRSNWVTPNGSQPASAFLVQAH
jgi:hypothetical protein